MPSGSALLQRALQRIPVYLLLVLAAVIFLFPFYWLLISSFESQSEMFTLPPRWFPHPLRLENFVELYQQTNLVRAFVNSAIVSTGSVVLSLFLCSLAGYAFAKYPNAPGQIPLFGFVLSTMMIPGAVLMIPLFEILIKIHWVNTYLAMIVPGAAGAFGIFWMRQYFNANLPDELVHAARIDGCNEFGIYFRIALPIARPALAALGIMQLIGSWNNLMWAIIVLRTPDMYTLPIVIYLLHGEMRTPYGILMAGGLLTTLPLVLAFLLFQKQFISGITAGAVKQ
jgi:cellobiose transport system permease protein